VSPELELVVLLASVDGFFVSSLFAALLSPESVFAGDFVSLGVELDSLDEDFFEP
jgi:hypothetical protein